MYLCKVIILHVLFLRTVLHAIELSKIGQDIEGVSKYIRDTQIKSWAPVPESMQGEFIYIVDFNYLMNGIEVDFIDIMLPDPLSYINVNVEDIRFSLVYWQCDKLKEDFPPNLVDIPLTLYYKLELRPQKAPYLWNEGLSRLIVPCKQLGCVNVPVDHTKYVYLGWIFDTNRLEHEAISFVQKQGVITPETGVYEEIRTSSIEIGDSRNFLIKTSSIKMKLFSISYYASELKSARVTMTSPDDISFSVDLTQIHCYDDSKHFVPDLMILELLTDTELPLRHYITISPTLHYELYERFIHRATSNTIDIELSYSTGNYSLVLSEALILEAKISSLITRFKCPAVVETTDKVKCDASKLDPLCSGNGVCDHDECHCNEYYTGTQCSFPKMCLTRPCSPAWYQCSPEKYESYGKTTCLENIYFPRLSTTCTVDTDCSHIFYSICSYGFCVCQKGYNRNSSLVFGVRNEVCLKSYLPCDKDSDCFYLHKEMICDKTVTPYRCVCGIESFKDPDNGICIQFLDGSHSITSFEWRLEYTVGLAASAVLVIALCGLVAFMNKRQSRLNQSESNRRRMSYVMKDRPLSSAGSVSPAGSMTESSGSAASKPGVTPELVQAYADKFKITPPTPKTSNQSHTSRKARHTGRIQAKMSSLMERRRSHSLTKRKSPKETGLSYSDRTTASKASSKLSSSASAASGGNSRRHSSKREGAKSNRF